MYKNCLNCNRIFYASRSDQLFCSKTCRNKYYSSGIFTLTLKKKWFDMILEGTKTEEYREIKPYWEKRFKNLFTVHYGPVPNSQEYAWQFSSEKKEILFRNGYGTERPSFIADCSIKEDTGKEEWGATPGITYYVLTIHNIRKKEHC